MRAKRVVSSENYLRRELDRVETYFDDYERELATRATRTGSEATKMKSTARLEAARAERVRRRADQVARHEIRIHPSVSAHCLCSAIPSNECFLLPRIRH